MTLTVQPVTLKTDTNYKSYQKKHPQVINSDSSNSNVVFGAKIPYLGLRVVTVLMFLTAAAFLAVGGYNYATAGK